LKVMREPILVMLVEAPTRAMDRGLSRRSMAKSPKVSVMRWNGRISLLPVDEKQL
jgi:hypothetical protein